MHMSLEWKTMPIEYKHQYSFNTYQKYAWNFNNRISSWHIHTGLISIDMITGNQWRPSPDHFTLSLSLMVTFMPIYNPWKTGCRCWVWLACWVPAQMTRVWFPGPAKNHNGIPKVSPHSCLKNGGSKPMSQPRGQACKLTLIRISSTRTCITTITRIKRDNPTLAVTCKYASVIHCADFYTSRKNYCIILHFRNHSNNFLMSTFMYLKYLLKLMLFIASMQAVSNTSTI